MAKAVYEDENTYIVNLAKKCPVAEAVVRNAQAELSLFSKLTETAANVYIQDLANLVAIRENLTGYEFYPMYVMDLSTVHYVQ